MADIKYKYAASASLTFTSLASLASSSTLVAGAESAAIDNGTTLYDDVYIGVSIKMGSSACTANKSIEVWIIPAKNDTPTWPDVFDGTDSAETVTSRNLLFGYGYLAKSFITDTTANQVYDATFSVISACGFVPDQFVLFVVQDSGQALASSASAAHYTGIHYQTV